MSADELTRLYDDEFFREFGAQNDSYAAESAFIAREIVRRFSPRTVVDWGCGAGLHAAAIASLGVEVLAVDGATVAPEHLAPGLVPAVADLREPGARDVAPQAYDLSLCIDVLEHIEAADQDTVLANITAGARTVIMSCAPPGQGGHHHVNEQPRRYWIAAMAAIGWTYDRRATGAMENYFIARRDRLTRSWMYHNLCVYRRHTPAARRTAAK